MTPLGRRILGLIRAQGPISVAHYMALALGDPEHGYYMGRDPFGRSGDFVTAPEISQIFGELIGLFLVQAWEESGLPAKFHLVELGPGRGTLMADLWRAAKIRPGFREAAVLTLVETSPSLRARQAQALEDAHPRWAHSLAEIADDAPLFLVANEFFDALPIRQFVKGKRGWHERMIVEKDGGLGFALAPEALPASFLAPALRDAPEGVLVETAPSAQSTARAIAARLATHGGAALIVDYGHAEPRWGETFQAVRSHAHADPLDAPGEADLTAHVDFASLAEAAREMGARSFGPVSQGAFLNALGLGARGEMLKRAAPSEARTIDAAIDRLAGEAQMGHLFKAMAMAPSSTMSLPGFPC
jgi:NADH dehydrogenase [ubiquinone] 1 alpha subcomplex assembly factor 7